MKVIPTNLPGVLIIEPVVFRDHRGEFLEAWSAARFREAGIHCDFVQENISVSVQNTIRGLHFQNPHPQAKLVEAIDGEIFDVAVDIRAGSPTFGQWAGVALSSINRRQLFVPKGMAHGFAVMSAKATVLYKTDEYYHRESDRAVRWNDLQIGVAWPVKNPILSEKDTQAPSLSQLAPEAAPKYRP